MLYSHRKIKLAATLLAMAPVMNSFSQDDIAGGGVPSADLPAERAETTTADGNMSSIPVTSQEERDIHVSK